MKMYQTNHWNCEVLEVEIVKKTDCFVTYKSKYGDRIDKSKIISDTYSFFDTRLQALEYLRSLLIKRIEENQNEFNRIKKEWENIDKLIELETGA